MKNVLCVFFAVFVLVGSCFATGSDGEMGDIPEVEEGEVQVSVGEEVPQSSVPDMQIDEVINEVEVVEDDDGVVTDAGYPLPVTIVPEDVSFALFNTGIDSSIDMVIGNTPPDDIPFYGAGYITGTVSGMGTVTLWFPIDYKGSFGVDSDGYLINITSASKSGYMEDVYNNSVSAQAFSYPRYRVANNQSYTTLYLKPTNSNLDIATAISPYFDFEQVYPYIMVMLLGVVIVCCMKRW